MGHIALEVPIGALAFGRTAQRHDSADAGVHALGDPLDDAPFAGGVAALEQDDDFQPLVLDPFLQLDEFDLQPGQFRFVDFVFQLGAVGGQSVIVVRLRSTVGVSIRLAQVVSLTLLLFAFLGFQGLTLHDDAAAIHNATVRQQQVAQGSLRGAAGTNRGPASKPRTPSPDLATSAVQRDKQPGFSRLCTGRPRIVPPPIARFVHIRRAKSACGLNGGRSSAGAACPQGRRTSIID